MTGGGDHGRDRACERLLGLGLWLTEREVELTDPMLKMSANMGLVDDVGETGVRLIGAVEILGAVGDQRVRSASPSSRLNPEQVAHQQVDSGAIANERPQR